MAKVICERPRKWSYDRNRPMKGVRKRFEKEFSRAMETGDSPSIRETIAQRYGVRRFFNEHLSPLRRFLDSQVGRPWSKVYSEICQYIDKGNLVQKHLLTHLFDYVATNCQIINGEVWTKAGFYVREMPIHESYRFRQYVCPKTGLLKAVQKTSWKRRKRSNPQPVYGTNQIVIQQTIRVNDQLQCIRLGGDWYLVFVEPIHPLDPFFPKRNPASDVLLGTKVHKLNRETTKAVYGRHVYAVKLIKLRKHEWKRYPIPM